MIGGMSWVGRVAPVVEVLVCVPFGEEFVGRIQAVDERVNVRMAPAELRRWLRGERDDNPEFDRLVEQQIAECLKPAEVIIGWPRLPQAALDAAVSLRWLQTASAGIDRADPEVFKHITMTNASGVAAVAMAEYVIGMILMFAKGFPHLMRRQQAREWDRTFEGREVWGSTCGIVGMGAIGGETARRAKALGMRVLATRRSVSERTPDELADELLPSSDLPYLLGESDYVVVAAPLTPETRHLIGADELRQMKRTAVLINVGRGPIIDEEALIAALRDGTIAGAGLDVTYKEPLPEESPLWGMDNVVITPHISADTPIYADRTADIVCDNLRRYLAGEPLRNIVDLVRGY
jgi:phosphoglycerate dehydrogenase-like enzyme